MHHLALGREHHPTLAHTLSLRQGTIVAMLLRVQSKVAVSDVANSFEPPWPLC